MCHDGDKRRGARVHFRLVCVPPVSARGMAPLTCLESASGGEQVLHERRSAFAEALSGGGGGLQAGKTDAHARGQHRK